MLVKILVTVAAIGVALMVFALAIAPLTPEGSLFYDAGQAIRDFMSDVFNRSPTLDNPRVVPVTVN